MSKLEIIKWYSIRYVVVLPVSYICTYFWYGKVSFERIFDPAVSHQIRGEICERTTETITREGLEDFYMVRRCSKLKFVRTYVILGNDRDFSFGEQIFGRNISLNVVFQNFRTL